MNELTIEEKAKRYDEALALMQDCIPDENGLVHVVPEEIFPELADSEDEKIRKEIIQTLKRYTECVEEGNYAPSAKDFLIKNTEKLISWLEKQVEQKPTELPKGEDYGIDGLYVAVDILQKTLGSVEGYQTDDGILEHECAVSAVKKLYEQKPAWSEEDKMMLQYAIEHFERQKRNCIEGGDRKKAMQEFIDWLKHLKDRVQPQPKQEWSEEDEKKRTLLISILEVNHPNSYFKVNPANTLNMEAMYTEELISWLKSLKERYTWKPSDEQMEALENAIRYGEEELVGILSLLYNDLKKLKD